MKRILTGASVAVAALAVAPAIAQVAQAPHAAHADKAHSRAEVQAKVAEHFARVDANRDGVVTKAEAEAVRAERRERRGERIAERREDRFDRLDANKDGQLSRAEFDGARELREQRRAARPGRMHLRAMRGRLHGRMFEMADANKDGRVTLQEAQAAALSHFDMADANRDGQVSRDERMQMRQRMRAERPAG
jgi:hypothetical protein